MNKNKKTIIKNMVDIKQLEENSYNNINKNNKNNNKQKK